LDPTSPYKNRGDIIEVKINNGKSNEITKANKKKRPRKQKPKCCVVLSSKHGHEEKIGKHLIMRDVVQRSCFRSASRNHSGASYFWGWVLTLFESQA
jgi:hypothetical protein